MSATQPLSDIRILDLSRILAGPICTQFLGDYGADVIKIERPGAGDDTRKWGPPYVKGKDGKDSTESAYYLCANRNKRSIAINIATPEGQKVIKDLVAECDVIVENYKVGGLKKYGLSYEDLKDEFPGLVYCSITGFGQDGPYSKRPGYDYLAQGMGGIMSITGEPEGHPTKVGVAITDVVTGMHAVTGILAALRHKDKTGEGQHIDCCLLDSQVSWLVNEASNYLVSEQDPIRRGNNHASIVPYRTFEAKNGFIILAIGNDGQFMKWCEVVGADELSNDPRFQTNKNRVENREALDELIPPYIIRKTVEEWLTLLAANGVPCGPVNTIPQVFEDPHILHRGMKIEMDHPLAETGKVPLVGNPVKFSKTPVQYRNAPPTCGQHTSEILNEVLGLNDEEITNLRKKEVIG